MDPVSAKKKPGRKPASMTPALRKAQNRAAQRAFRERKEKHIAELEAASRQLREQRERLMAENKALRGHVSVLGYEGWHLKGVMLSLQLVCFMNSIAIPNHSPYLDHERLPEQDTVSPHVLEAYTTLCKRNAPSTDSKHPDHHLPHRTNSNNSNPLQQYVSTASILVFKDSIQTVVGNRISTRFRASPPPSDSARSRSSSLSDITDRSLCGKGSPKVGGRHSSINHGLHSLHSDDAASLDGADGNQEQLGKGIVEAGPDGDGDNDDDDAVFNARPIMLTREPIPSFNTASLQTMRLRHHLKAACAKIKGGTFVVKPTVLQTSVPHDPRIDLIPVAAVRDRMILLCELFDLDDCIACMLKDAGIDCTGDDPSEASSWRFPTQFYEDYWYLMQDYSIDDIRRRWPELQRMQADGALQTLLSKAANLNAQPSGSDVNRVGCLSQQTFPYPFQDLLLQQGDGDILPPPLESIDADPPGRKPSHERPDNWDRPVALHPPDRMLLDRQ